MAASVIAGISLLTIASAMNEYREIKRQLNNRGETLARQVSQRADQHDAHLSSLSALASGAGEPLEASVIQVGETIRQFYPRIVGINLVSLDRAKAFSVAMNAPYPTDMDRLHGAIREGARASDGRLVVLPDPNKRSSYLLIKRSPNSDDARFGLALTIDADKLLDDDDVGSTGSLVSLTLPDSSSAMTSRGSIDDANTGEWFRPLRYSTRLSSVSQPLRMEIVKSFSPAELISIPNTVILSVLWISAVVVFFIIRDQRSKTREAQLRAGIREHEALIARASSINSLGEMASGIAHELNQPLTALLSQSQAALRMLPDEPRPRRQLVEALEANVAQAKRAGEILHRLRNWVKRDEADSQSVDVERVVMSVVDLMQQTLIDKRISLDTGFPDISPTIACDSVQFEQVVFNLLTNAMEAVESRPESGREISIIVSRRADEALIEILDNGNGISAEVEARLFEPFFTTKQNGMGFGLPLCESILQGMGGRLDIENRETGGALARITLPIERKTADG